MNSVSLSRLLAGGDPIVVEEVEHELLVARMEQALFGHESVPLTLGRYQVIEKVGRGGGGTVYRGRDPDLHRTVAIKVVHRDSGALDELFREAQALAQLRHPHVVEVYDVFCEPERGRVVIILQWIEGHTAEVWQRDASVEAVIKLYRDAGRGLAAAHRAGLVHRDVKPANLLVTDEGHVRVADFGLAHAEGTHTRDIAGTPAYMAPEQWRCGAATARSDQYSFCASMIEALLPHGSGNDLEGALRQRGVNARVRRALARGLRIDPSTRFDTMDALLAELAPRRRKLMLPAALALATSSIAGFLAPPATVDACGNEAAGMHDDWVARASSIHDGFGDAAQRVEGAVTSFADRWSTAWAASCELDASEGDRRRHCLQSQRWHVTALVDLLADTGADATPRALSAVAGLPSPAICEAPAEAGLAGWMPEDEAAQAAVDGYRQRLATATASFAAGRYREGAIACETLLAELEHTPFDPLALMTRIALGRFRSLDGHPDEGRELFTRAYLDAVEGGHDREAAEAATALVFTVGYQQTDIARGTEWARHADAALTRLGIEGEPRAELLNHRGTMVSAAGDLAAAREFHEQALSIREPLANPTALAHTLNNLGNVELRARDLPRAREHHARALALRQEIYGPAHPIVATSLNNLGSVTMLEQTPSAARSTFERALAAWEASLGPDHPDLLSALHNLTVVAVNEDRLDDAQALVDRARRIAEARLPPDHPAALLVDDDEKGLREWERTH